jgi:heme oxygenase
MSSQLATRLREGTQQAHSLTENAGFIQCFLKGAVEKTSYRQLLGNFYFVYTTLESRMQAWLDHPFLNRVYFPEVHRQESLAKDLAYFWGKEWREDIHPSVATQRYVARIDEVAIADPLLIVAHAYTRYLGDLSGGQILKKIAQRGMNLQNGEGTAFYDFAEIEDTKAFKATYRQALNDLPVDEAEILKIVAEANFAFKLNMALFQELEGNLMQALGQLLFKQLVHPRQPQLTSWPPKLADTTSTLQPQD